MSIALSLCQYVLRPRRGLAQASPGLAQASPSLRVPRLQAFEARDLLHQHNRKGHVVMIKTRRSKRLVFGFVFCTLNWYEFWRRSGASLVVVGQRHPWLDFLDYVMVFFFSSGLAVNALWHGPEILDYVMVHALFRLPKKGCCCTLHNSFNGTNTVLRPGESQEGEGRKKNSAWAKISNMHFFLAGARYLSAGHLEAYPRTSAESNHHGTLSFFSVRRLMAFARSFKFATPGPSQLH